MSKKPDTVTLFRCELVRRGDSKKEHFVLATKAIEALHAARHTLRSRNGEKLKVRAVASGRRILVQASLLQKSSPCLNADIFRLTNGSRQPLYAMACSEKSALKCRKDGGWRAKKLPAKVSLLARAQEMLCARKPA